MADKIAAEIGCSAKLAEELLILAGGDVDRVIECSHQASGLDQCKILIINDRLSMIENALWLMEEYEGEE